MFGSRVDNELLYRDILCFFSYKQYALEALKHGQMI